MDEELKKVYRYALRGAMIKDRVYARCDDLGGESRFIKIYAYRNDHWMSIATLMPNNGPSLEKAVDLLNGVMDGARQ